MTGTRRPVLPLAGDLRGMAAAVVGGLLTGGFAAWAYYGDTFRPLAHTFGLWITLVVLLSARRPAREAVVSAVLALASAVLTFYVGKQVMYGIEHPGLPYALDRAQIEQWLVLALVVGTLFGWLFSHAGEDGWLGAFGTAGAVGLLVADTVRRSWTHGVESSAVPVAAVLFIGLVLAGTVRSWQQLGLVALWTAPMAVFGLVLVSAPDALEQLLVTGSL
jgi:FtsH-binding integral membrane protein